MRPISTSQSVPDALHLDSQPMILEHILQLSMTGNDIAVTASIALTKAFPSAFSFNILPRVQDPSRRGPQAQLILVLHHPRLQQCVHMWSINYFSCKALVMGLLQES